MMKDAPRPGPPISDFVGCLKVMAARRHLIQGCGIDPTILEDLSMMLHEGVIIGIRNRWVRRVAVPLFQAHRLLKDSRESDPIKAKKVLQILEQCEDIDLKSRCIEWVKSNYWVNNDNGNVAGRSEDAPPDFGELLV